MLPLMLAGAMALGGSVGAKMDAFFQSRVFGPEARGRIYEEAVGAFRTHADDKGWWQGEYWGKTMLSSAAVAEYADDAGLKDWLREKARAFVKEFQRPDGYLGTYSDPYFVGGPVPGQPGKEVFCWNLWGRKYTMWALLEIARVADAPDLREAAARMMDQWIAQLRERNVRIEDTGYFSGLPSMSVLKPLLLLYGATGRRRYLDYADEIVAAWEREGNPVPNLLSNALGDRPVHAWYPNPGRWAKAYEMMSCLEGLVAYAAVKDRPQVRDAVVRIVSKLEAAELNGVGSVGFFDHFTHASVFPNVTTEPCDVTHWIRVNRDLYRATGEAHYLDTLEFAFYNAFLAGVYRDGKWGAHAVRSHGSRHRAAPHQVGMRFHQCCIDNMPRTFVDFAATAVDRTADGTLSVNLYSDATGSDGAEKVEITGGYPFGDTVTVKVVSGKGGRIRFRNPRWFESLSLDGKPVSGAWGIAPLKPGENVFRLAFVRRARLVDAPADFEPKARAREYETVHETPEMAGLARTAPAARLCYGPLLLAKAKRLGCSRAEILDFASVNGRGFSCALAPLGTKGVDGAWTATFSRDGESFAVRVCDFASVADSDDPENLFSIWF